MFSSQVAALVCEGHTDVPVLREVVLTLWPELEDVRVLQPELDETERVPPGGRAGWSEVQTWCEQNADELDEILDPLVGDPIDILLLVVDMDIAIEAGIANPPQSVGAYESPRLREKVVSWLLGSKRKRLPSQVVVSTPVMAIEAWIIAALFPKQRQPENLPDPAGFLVAKKKLRKSPRDGSPWKELHLYRDFACRVGAKLARVRGVCPEAERTCGVIEARRNACANH